MKTPAISVVCSAYNAAQHLRESLASALSQEGSSLELIVVNDGSTDTTPQILDQVAAIDPRVRVIHQENQGLTRALIAGCRAARGQYIARLDTDDLCLPGRIRMQAELLDRHPEVSFVSCWSRAVGPANEILFETHRPADIDEATNRLLCHRQGPTAHGSVMFRRDCFEKVGGYRQQFYFAQDSDLWLRLGEVGKLAYIPQVLYAFRISPGGVSSKYREVQHALGELAHACRNARLQGLSEDVNLEQAARLRPGLAKPVPIDPIAGDYFIGRCLARRGDIRAARYLSRVLIRRPWRMGVWLGLVQCCIGHASTRRVHNGTHGNCDGAVSDQ